MEVIKKLSNPIIFIAGFIFSASLLYGFWLSLQIIHVKFGLFAAIASCLFAPFTIIVTPLWSGFAEGYWTPAIYIYAPLLVFLAIAIIFMISIFVLHKLGFDK